MIGPLIIAGLALALLALLALLLNRQRHSDDHLLPIAMGLSEADRLPPREVLTRIFDVADVDFVAAEGSKALMALLLDERRALALHWLRQIRREAFAILAHHRRSVRYQAALRPSQEARVLLHALSFFAIHCTVSVMVYLYGAFHAHALISQLFRFCDRLANLRNEMLAEVGMQQAPALN
jgi:hypothetical protein